MNLAFEQIGMPTDGLALPQEAKEQERRPWGDLSDAMEMGLIFWSGRFGPGYDIYGTIDGTPVLKEKIRQILPSDCDSDLPRLITHVTNMMIYPGSKDDFIVAFNTALLNLTVNDETTAIQEIVDMRDWYRDKRFSRQTVEDIIKLAKIMLNKTDYFMAHAELLVP
jgi:hypothetical protein